MRIACYYGDMKSCARNDGMPMYIWYNLGKIFGKENVRHIFPTGDLSIYGKFDLHVLVDFAEDNWGYENFEVPHPSIYWVSDTHLAYEYRLSRAKRCDYIFCICRKAVDDFIRDGIPKERIMWLPPAFDPWAYSPGVFNVAKNNWDVTVEPLKKYDVCFIGNLNYERRVRYLDRLFREFPNFHWGTQRFHEAAEKYNQSKVVFNISSANELNMRYLEALGSRSFLLTDNTPPELNIFKEGIHYIGYDNMDDMVDKCKYYIDHEEERKKIAQQGYEEACSKHTYIHRIITMLDFAGVKYDKNLAESLLPKETVEA